MGDALRTRVAARLGASPDEVALTGATTDGVNAVIGGLDLGPGDEVLTTDEEHPGLLAPLAIARQRRRRAGARGRRFARASRARWAPTPGSWPARTCRGTPAGWSTREVSPPPARPCCSTAPRDWARSRWTSARSGCDYYAASGQKWLCGPVGSGYLYVRRERLEELAPPAPGYGSLTDPVRALELPAPGRARRASTRGCPPSHHLAWALAALDVLEEAGFDAVLRRGPELAAQLADLLAGRGLTVAPRGRATLVSWEAPDPRRSRCACADAGFVVRNLPGTPYVRASVGAWSSEEELEGLAAAAAATSGS